MRTPRPAPHSSRRTVLVLGSLAVLCCAGCYERTLRAEGITARRTHGKISQPTTTIDQEIGQGIRNLFSGGDSNDNR